VDRLGGIIAESEYPGPAFSTHGKVEAGEDVG